MTTPHLHFYCGTLKRFIIWIKIIPFQEEGKLSSKIPTLSLYLLESGWHSRCGYFIQRQGKPQVAADIQQAGINWHCFPLPEHTQRKRAQSATSNTLKETGISKHLWKNSIIKRHQNQQTRGLIIIIMPEAEWWRVWPLEPNQLNVNQASATY